jgi:PKD repeat protein
MLAIFILLLLFISPVLAADTAVAITTGTTTKDATSIIMDNGCVTFTATDTKLAATTTTLIDGKLFVPETTAEKSTSLAWETPDAKMEYSYTGKTLKETITLKEDKKLSFPITLAKDSKLIPWGNGQWKIVSSVTSETMAGVILEKPYGIDDKGNRIEMDYTYRDGILNLEYNRTITKYTTQNVMHPNGTPYFIIDSTYSEIAYPLVIDPTWVVVGDREECTDCVPGFTIVRWTATGSTTWTPPAGVTSVRALVVAGGGGGGGGYFSAGGGAGGMVEHDAKSVTPGVPVTVTVGGGGTGGATFGFVGARGTNSVFSDITANKGGGGGSYNMVAGTSGGSSGGGAANAGGQPGAVDDGGSLGGGTAYGYTGGTGSGSTGAAGGGAGGVGGNGGTNNNPPITLNHRHNDITGVNEAYANGGQGGADTVPNPTVAGTANTGNGGSAGRSSNAGATGGTGIVIIKYADAPYTSSILINPFQSSIYATNVNFTLSVANVSPQNWTFGDTYTSTRKDNVTHFYSVAGNYTATHAVTTPAGFFNLSTTFNLTSDVDANVKSWLHMNGANGGTSFPGEIGSAWIPNSVTTDTGTKKFGTASALFNANGDRLSTPSSAVFNFGTGNFTIEQWVYPTSSASNDFIISRTTSGATKADGWGIYHSTASATSDGWVFWAGTAAAGSTGTFSIPLNTWNHVVVQRISGTVNVSVNGIQVAQKTGLNGNYDTANSIAYGDPIAGAGTNSAKMYLDETRISSAERWDSGGTDFSSPYAEYRGNLLSLYTDLNPNSTLRFKTDVPNPAIISNMTARNRTIQIQYFQNATNISATVVYNPDHVFASYVYANKTMYSDVNITYVAYDTVLGQVKVNATRPEGFYTGSFTDSRASLFDIRMVYWNYTPPSEQVPGSETDIANYQYFSNGYQRNGTTGYEFPIHNFIVTNASFSDWETFSNFTTYDRFVGNQTIFTPSDNNFTANRWTWDFGDGTAIITGNSSYPEPHMYVTAGTFNVSCTAYLWQNTSVSNTTYLPTTIAAALNYVHADFAGSPLAGSAGLLVQFTDKSMFGTPNATSGRTYNWSFGDAGLTVSPTSNQINPSHVYSTTGTYSVTLIVNNTLNSDTEVKESYITISTTQQNTWYTPKQISVVVMSYNTSTRVVGANVTLVAIGTSLQDTGQLQTIYGVNPSAANQMVNGTLIMSSFTGGDGGTVFTVLGSIRYNAYVTDPVTGILYTVPLNPGLDPYIIWIGTNPLTITPSPQMYMNNTRLYFEQPDAGNVTLALRYQDTSGKTSNVRFIVKAAANMTVIVDENLGNPGTGIVFGNRTYPNILGDSYFWYYNATKVT